jgi:hypothetical protein
VVRVRRRTPARRRMAAAPARRASGERGPAGAGVTVTAREAVVRAVRERWVVRAVRAVRERWVVPATEAWAWTG